MQRYERVFHVCGRPGVVGFVCGVVCCGLVGLMSRALPIEGDTTVNELIAVLLEFPPSTVVRIRTEHPNAQGELLAVVDGEETILMDTWATWTP